MAFFVFSEMAESVSLSSVSISARGMDSPILKHEMRGSEQTHRGADQELQSYTKNVRSDGSMYVWRARDETRCEE